MIEYTDVVLSSIEILAYFASMVYLCTARISLDNTFKLALVYMGFAMTLKATSNLLLAIIDQSTHVELFFVLWNLQVKSLLLMNLTFYIVFAKIYSMLMAFSRRQLSKSLELIKKTNSMITFIGTTALALALLTEVISTAIYFANEDSSQF